MAWFAYRIAFSYQIQKAASKTVVLLTSSVTPTSWLKWHGNIFTNSGLSSPRGDFTEQPLKEIMPALLFDLGDAGLLLPAIVRELVDHHLDLGCASGRANTGDKLLTLVASALAGGDFIDDAETVGVLGCVVKAPSTLGTFLRMSVNSTG